MKKNRLLDNIINNAVKMSFDGSKLSHSKAGKIIKSLKSLPTSQAIYALNAYLKGLRSLLEKHTLTIESANNLSQNEQNSILKELKKDHTINEIKNITNPSLLGNIKVKIGDNVLDYTLRNKIEQIAQTIKG